MANQKRSGPASDWRISQVHVTPYRLALRLPLRTARETLSERRGWLIRMNCENGMSGWGDCAPMPVFGTESFATAEEKLLRFEKEFAGLAPDELLTRLDNSRETPAARCGLETAVADLLAKRAGMPLASWLNSEAAEDIACNAFVGALDAGFEQRVEEASKKGYRVLKIKMGIADLDSELSRLRDLSGQLTDGVSLRLDVNRAWDQFETERALAQLERLPVESLEEPLAESDPVAYRRLQERAPFPLALDESWPGWQEQDLFQYPSVKRLVFKPMREGGPLATYRLAEKAIQAGLECVVTTMFESAVGVWSTAHLASALNNGLFHGLDTSSWLQADLAEAPLVQSGQLAIQEHPGLGIEIYGL